MKITITLDEYGVDIEAKNLMYGSFNHSNGVISHGIQTQFVDHEDTLQLCDEISDKLYELKINLESKKILRG